METELIQAAEHRANQVAKVLYKEREQGEVGGALVEAFIWKGKTHTLTVDAFWETSMHFDYSISFLEMHEGSQPFIPGIL